jgi:hypothetical protein
MMEMRWNVTQEGTKTLQYRQQYNSTIYAGMPDQYFVNRTAKMVWSDWKDVPTVVDVDLNCP